jgi:hypothetical protein
MTQTELTIVKESELSLNGSSSLNAAQLGRLLKKTPEKYIKTRPAKGGGTWKYLSGGYVKKTLNIMFGWDWDFEILEQLIVHGECVVKGRLTVRTNGTTIVKNQFGNKDIVYRKELDIKGERVPLSIGNDLKSAATDALKKCASELGIGADVYNAEEFQSIAVVPDSDFESVSLQKEMNRVKNYITNATTRKELLTVLDFCEDNGLIEIYDNRINEIDNATK